MDAEDSFSYGSYHSEKVKLNQFDHSQIDSIDTAETILIYYLINGSIMMQGERDLTAMGCKLTTNMSKTYYSDLSSAQYYITLAHDALYRYSYELSTLEVNGLNPATGI